MGLFEKQIPKYVEDVDGNVTVEPVVVDDIFDPLFNAEVRAQLEDTYGNSPLATLGGYQELLDNVWVNNEGTFGKGMGLLSAFGRSMEKADDIILGAATEAVEGVSGQGFDNPLKQIFVEDEDYTGRRFLAAAANTMRGFADGTTVTEEDFGPEWGLPALGIELVSDVGVLGGGLARSLAPELAQQAGKRVTSSEILRNLGKSGNAKTTIGEVGQLLSDYDDLMTRAAIDITAPGLRPAFKTLLPRLKQWVGFTDADDFVDVTMPMTSAPRPKNIAEGGDGAFELYKNAYRKYKEIPETVEEAVERMSRTPEQIAEQLAAESELEALNEVVEDVLEQEAAAMSPELAQEATKPAPKAPRPKKALRNAEEVFKTKRYRESVETTAASYVHRALLHSMQETSHVPDLTKFDVVGTHYVPDGKAYKGIPMFRAKPDPKFPSTNFSKVSTAERAMLREMYPVSANEFSGFYSDVYVKSKKQLEQYIRSQNLSETDAQILRESFNRTWKGSNRQEIIDGLRPYFTSDAPHKATSAEMFEDTAQKSFKKAADAVTARTQRHGEAISEMLKRAEKHGVHIESLGIDKHREGTIAERFAKLFKNDVGLTPVKEGQVTKYVWAQTPPDFKEFTPEQKSVIDEVRQILSEAIGLTDAPLSDDLTRKPLLSVHTSYLNDLIDTLSDDAKLAQAVYTGEWAPEDVGVSALINAFLNDPKRADSLFYRTSNPDWYISPSEMAVVRLPEVKDGLSHAYAMVDDLRYLNNGETKTREAIFNNEKEFNKWFDTDRMQVVLNTLFDAKFSKDPGVDITELTHGKVSKFKKLLKDVIFPKPKDADKGLQSYEAFQKLDDLIEYFDKNFDIWDIPDDMLVEYADEISYLTHMSNTLETIARDFISPIKGWGNATRDTRLDFRFSKGDIVDDYSLSYNTLFKAIVGQLGTHKLSYDALMDIVEPIKEYAQLGFKSGSQILTTLSDGTPTHAAKVVDRFYNEALPVLERVMAANLNPFNVGSLKYVPKDLKEDFKKFLSLFGYTNEMFPDVQFDPEHVAFRDILNNILLNDKHSFTPTKLDLSGLPEGYSLEQAFEHVLSKNPKAYGGFKASRPTDTLFEDVTPSRIDEYGMQVGNQKYNWQDSPTKLPFLATTTPSKFKELSDVTLRDVRAQELNVLEENPGWRSDVTSMYDSFYKRLKAMVDDYGITEDRLSDMLKKFEDPELRKTLSPDDVRFIHRYSIAYKKGVGDLPYHVISLRTFEYYDEARRAEFFSEKFPYGLPMSLRPLKERRANLKIRREYIKGNKPHTLLDLDFKGSAFYKQIRATYPEMFSRENMLLEMISKADISDRERDILRSFLRNDSVPTANSIKYVRDTLIAHLSPEHRKFEKFWNPNETLFDFDLPEQAVPDYIRIGENVPLHPAASQVFERYGKRMPELIVSPPEKSTRSGKYYGHYVGAIDYTKLFGNDFNGIPARENLMRTVAKRDFQMEYIQDTPFVKKSARDIYEDIRSTRYTFTAKPSAGAAPEVVKTVEDTIEAQPVEATIQQFVEPVQTSLQEAAVQSVVNEICPTVATYLESGLPMKQVSRMLEGSEEWRWYEQIMKAANVRSVNASGDFATARSKAFEDIVWRMEALTSEMDYKNLKRFYILKEKQIGDILTGDKFWEEFISTGMFSTAYKKGSSKIDILKNAMQRNADTINRILDGNYVEVVVHNITGEDPNTVAVTMRWLSNKDTPNTDLIRRIANNKEALSSAKYETLLFSPPETLSEAELEFLGDPKFAELMGLEAEAQSLIQNHYRHLGFTFDPSSAYTRHALNNNPDVAFFLGENFYGQVHSETLDDICDQLSTLYNTRRAFGSRITGRRFRGHYWDTERKVLPIFSYNPVARFKSAITGGALANSQYQAFTDFFFSDTFKIKGTFNTIEDLKKVLYANDSNGKLGNLTNAELVTYRMDATGRIIGLTKFDKMSDKGLQAALNDPNTILVPASAITSLDKMFRREARMSNKMWVFLNKHFTLPFKMGVLMNPGFLLGNISDASMKMATTMAKKYGTSMTHEAEEAARSMRTVVELKNTYYQAFDEFLEATKAAGFTVPVKESIPDIVAMNPKARDSFIKWTHGKLTTKQKIGEQIITSPIECTLTLRQRDAANTWIILQEMQMNSSRLREFEDMAGLTKRSVFKTPNGPLGRIIEGDGAYDSRLKGWRTWGLFLNNPVVDGMMGASEGIEDLVRTATIVDDLRHHGYSDEYMRRIMASGTPAERLKLEVDLENAKNAMYSAQFDYERLTNFLDTVGTAVPFPIFFLKNFTYWMDLFQENPQFVDNMIDIQEGLWAHRKTEDENDEFAKQAKGRGAVPVGGAASLPEWFKGIYKPSPLQSMFSAFSMLNDPLGDISYRLHPSISAGIAQAHEQTPSDLTTLLRGSEEMSYRPYSTNIYERNVKESDPNFDTQQYALHRANPYERATQTYLRTPAKLKRGEAQLSDFLPSVFQPDF